MRRKKKEKEKEEYLWWEENDVEEKKQWRRSEDGVMNNGMIKRDETLLYFKDFLYKLIYNLNMDI